MKLVTTKLDADDSTDPTSWRVALVLPNGRLIRLVALARLAPDILAEEIDTLDLATVVALDPSGDAIARALEVAGPTAVQAASTGPEECRLTAAVPRPAKVVGVGYNYLDHIREQGLEKPSRPTLFSKFASSVVGDGSPIRHPAGTHALDFEAELAVVIGRRAHGVSARDAARCIGGYCVANDVTARDWQGQAPALGPGEKGDGQWLRAKGSDTFMPLGAMFVTPDELDAVPGATRDGRGLAVRSWLTKASGTDAGREIQMQDGNTSASRS